MDAVETNHRFEETLRHATRDQLVTALCVMAENLARISGGDVDDKERSLLSKEVVVGLIERGNKTNLAPGRRPQNEALSSILNTFGETKGICETWEERRLREIRQTLTFDHSTEDRNSESEN